MVDAAKEVPKYFMMMIQTIGVDSEQPLHAFHKVRARSLAHQMKVVAHQTPRMNPPVGFLAGLS
jgi:hypothetical protein